MIYIPGGKSRRSEVLKGREMTVTAAIDGLECGQEVWVKLGDAVTIETWLAGGMR
jgi:translation initiation factor IF-1